MNENVEILSGHESLANNVNLCPLLEKAKMGTFTEVLGRYVSFMCIYFFLSCGMHCASACHHVF